MHGREISVKLAEVLDTQRVRPRDLEGLAELARVGGGNFAALAADDSDVEALLAGPRASLGDLGELSPSEVKADVWEDMGVWLLWLPLCLAPLAFRRGWATALALPLMLGAVAPAPAARARHRHLSRDPADLSSRSSSSIRSSSFMP